MNKCLAQHLHTTFRPMRAAVAVTSTVTITTGTITTSRTKVLGRPKKKRERIIKDKGISKMYIYEQ